MGIAGAFTSQAGLSGQIWDDADPTFNNYIYGYHVQHGHVALKAKVFKDLDYRKELKTYPQNRWISLWNK